MDKADKIGFEPKGKLCASKGYHYLYIALMIILPIALIIFTIVKGTFQIGTLAVCALIVVVFLGFDISARSNVVYYNEDYIALMHIMGKPTVYEWKKLVGAQHSEETMLLTFEDNKKLYINMKYDGINEFFAMLEKVGQ